MRSKNGAKRIERKVWQRKQTMVENQNGQQVRKCALKEYTMPNSADNQNNILRPTIKANYFKIKPAIN